MFVGDRSQFVYEGMFEFQGVQVCSLWIRKEDSNTETEDRYDKKEIAVREKVLKLKNYKAKTYIRQVILIATEEMCLWRIRPNTSFRYGHYMHYNIKYMPLKTVRVIIISNVHNWAWRVTLNTLGRDSLTRYWSYLGSTKFSEYFLKDRCLF